MGTVFEELIRKFAEISNETAGEHFTPREVIRLMVNLIFVEDDDVLAKPGVVRTIYDPTAGTGGMLSVAGEYLAEHNPQARLTMYGQELNDESYAICKADMLIKGQDVANIIAGNTLSEDGQAHKVFDYMLSNPPFGVEWKKVEKAVRQEYETQGFNGRFGPGLPRVSDGSLLFLLHLHLQDAPRRGWRQPLRHRAQWLAAVYRWRWQRRERNPPLRSGERSGRGHHRPAHRHVLQHRHLHLRLDSVEPQARRARARCN
jgi:type I restriction-modification system DNA methylase subunit